MSRPRPTRDDDQVGKLTTTLIVVTCRTSYTTKIEANRLRSSRNGCTGDGVNDLVGE